MNITRTSHLVEGHSHCYASQWYDHILTCNLEAEKKIVWPHQTLGLSVMIHMIAISMIVYIVLTQGGSDKVANLRNNLEISHN